MGGPGRPTERDPEPLWFAYPTTYARTWPTTQVLDANGDGLSDLAHVIMGQGPALPDDVYVSYHAGSVPDELAKIHDHAGLITVDYAPLTDAVVYTKGTDCKYPQRCVTGTSMRVVATHTDSLGHIYQHGYEDGRADVRGNGWLGFSKHSVVNQTTGATTETLFDNVTRVDTSDIEFYP